MRSGYQCYACGKLGRTTVRSYMLGWQGNQNRESTSGTQLVTLCPEGPSDAHVAGS